MRLFAVLAGHAELAAVDGDAYLHHGIPESQRRAAFVTFDVSCGEPVPASPENAIAGPLVASTERMVSMAASSRSATSRLVVSSARAARRREIKVGGQPRAIGDHRMQLSGQPLGAAVRLAPTFDRRLQRIERERKTFGGGVDRRLARSFPRIPLVSANTARIRQPYGRENPLDRQAVGEEILRCVAACRQRLTPFSPRCLCMASRAAPGVL